MRTGTLIDDLFQAVERAEKAAAQPRSAPENGEEVILVSTGASADQYSKQDSEAE